MDRGDWDRDEREALADLEEQVETIRRRHRADPPLDVLRAAQADVLPPDLQARIAQHLSESAWSRTLATGVEPDEGMLTVEDRDRLLARIVKEAGRDTAHRWRWLRPAFLGPALLAAASIAWLVSRGSDVLTPTRPPESTVAIAQPPPAFLLPLDKPEVRLSMAALTWRGSTGTNNQLLADLKPALDSYRRDDYAAAEREFAMLASRYPGTIEIHFYQGISRLFLNDVTGAIAALAAAEAVADRTFAADVSWYRAVAEEHAGNLTGARARLDSLCLEKGEGAVRACAALARLAAPAPSTPR